jgi:hypothetical protein
MESRLGHDFGRIRVHTDAASADSAARIGASAYTVGSDIVFAAGRYSPSSDSGRRLLGHELAHAVQQGARTTTGAGGFRIGEPGDRWEAEASRAESSVASGAPGGAVGPKLTAVPAGVQLLQRACDQPESFYRASPRFCLDMRFSPSTHPGKSCYRELIPDGAWGCPPGDHCCFSPDGSVEDSHDASRLADEKKGDGSCGWSWHCVIAHTITDYIPAVVGSALSPLTCAQQCMRTGAPELCMMSCVNAKAVP